MRGKAAVSRSDRPLIRDALLAGGVVAAGCIAALVSLDRSPRPRPHIGNVVAARADTSVEDSSPSSALHHERRAITTPKVASQVASSAPLKKKKSDDMTLFVMLPDSPPKISDTPPTGIWSDQGSPGPVTNGNGNAPAGGLISMASIGRTSLPLTSPTGGSSGGPQGASGGGVNPPVIPNPGGGPPPVGHHNPSQSHFGFVLLAGGAGAGQIARPRAQLLAPIHAVLFPSSPVHKASAR